MTFPDFSAPGATNPTKGPSHARTLGSSGGVARTVGMVLVGVLSLGVAGAATAVTQLTGNIDTAQMAVLGPDRPKQVLPKDPNAGTPLNIVVMGSDSRDGDNGDLAGGGEMGARSDTTLVMHISGDRSRVEMISVPRDSTVDVPSCTTGDGTTTAPLYGTKFNAAFSQGVQAGGKVSDGALCTVKAIEQLTGVFINGFIVVDFAGFSSMVDAVGGVEVCVEQEIYSEKANHLALSPGIHTLKGVKALDYARARTGDGLGDGSDLGRIGRQQEVMASLARKVLSQEVLTNPSKTLGFLGAVTDSLTMNQELASIDGLAGLAYSMRNVRPDTITFMTVPNEYDPNNRANVVWTDEATTLWDDVKNDRPVVDAPEGTTPSSSPSGSAGDGDTKNDDTKNDGTTDAETTTPDPSPSSTVIKQAGEEAFTSADTTKVCG
ncbi:LCP family protein [Promicromonospora thailandica]|uniref:Transcriptional attenuator, LytR family n=1 Tax=Promicromonospora thailandica TaxID=765201 RepID=A0A9X2G5S2_9MICO|nr:LCP family protein [Promicromonospora thailandica]MCP2266083.1 transcriptional attenuator, LytR family [Promicromonospora thailandica]